MFITLKNTGRGQGRQAETGKMEQVAQKNAGPDANNGKMRTLRRPACLSCQRKKLRCTGSSQNCDRCKSSSIDCVFPSTSSHSKSSSNSKTKSSRSTSDKTRTKDAHGKAPADHDDGFDAQSTLSEFTPSLPANNDPLDGDYSQYVQDFDANFEATDFSRETSDFYYGGSSTIDPYAGSSSSASYYYPADDQSLQSYSDPLSTTQPLTYTSSETLGWPAQGSSYATADETDTAWQYYQDATNNGYS